MASELGKKISIKFKKKKENDNDFISNLNNNLNTLIDASISSPVSYKIINYYWKNIYSEHSCFDLADIIDDIKSNMQDCCSFYANLILWLKNKMNSLKYEDFIFSPYHLVTDEFAIYCKNYRIDYDQVIALIVNDDSLYSMVINNIRKFATLSLWDCATDKNDFCYFIDSRTKEIIDSSSDEDTKINLVEYVIRFNKNSDDPQNAKNAIFDLLKDAYTYCTDPKIKDIAEEFFNASMLKDFRDKFTALKHNKDDPTSRSVPNKYFDIYEKLNTKGRIEFLYDLMCTALLIHSWHSNFIEKHYEK